VTDQAPKKRTPAEVAHELVERFIREERWGVGEVAEIFAEGSALVLEMARERLRLIDIETGQLQIVLGQGAPQRRSDRAAEDESVMVCLKQQPGSLTQHDIAMMTKLGARTAPTLQRLQRRDLVRAEGRGPASKWWWNPVPLAAAEPPAKPRQVAAPRRIQPEAVASPDERQMLFDEAAKQAGVRTEQAMANKPTKLKPVTTWEGD